MDGKDLILPAFRNSTFLRMGKPFIILAGGGQPRKILRLIYAKVSPISRDKSNLSAIATNKRPLQGARSFSSKTFLISPFWRNGRLNSRRNAPGQRFCDVPVSSMKREVKREMAPVGKRITQLSLVLLPDFSCPPTTSVAPSTFVHL